MASKNPIHNAKLPRALDQAVILAGKRKRKASTAGTPVGNRTNHPKEKLRENARKARQARIDVAHTLAVNGDVSTDFQERFLQEYLIDYNPGRAYIRAGGTPNLHNAAIAASGLLSKPGIKKHIEFLKAQSLERYKIDHDSVTGALARIAFSNVSSFVKIENGKAVLDFTNVTADDLFALSELNVDGNKIKLGDKKGALELLGKTRGLKLFVDSTELTGADGLPLTPPSLQVNFKGKK